MNVIKNRDLEKEERKLGECFYGTGIQFHREGDGIDTPIKMIIGFPSKRDDPDEVERISKILIAASKAAKEFKYNGYFVDYISQ